MLTSRSVKTKRRLRRELNRSKMITIQAKRRNLVEVIGDIIGNFTDLSWKMFECIWSCVKHRQRCEPEFMCSILGTHVLVSWSVELLGRSGRVRQSYTGSRISQRV